MRGIERIKIDSSWNDWRIKMSKDLSPTSSMLYRKIFDLLDGEEDITCSKKDAISRYDWKEGIDVLLHFTNGTKATLQEKFLDWKDDTCTFEEVKTDGTPGVWYYCTAQYYFVGYARRYKEEHILQFQSYIMVDLPGLHRADLSKKLPWYRNQNRNDGRKATFRYLYFKDVPEDVVISIYPSNKSQVKIYQPGLF
jgi:hypothetical protein